MNNVDMRGRRGRKPGGLVIALVAVAAATAACTPAAPVPAPAPSRVVTPVPSPGPATPTSAVPAPTVPTPTVTAPASPPPGIATQVLATPEVAAGTYSCMQWIYPGGNLASTGYNLVIGPGDTYRSTLGTDSPGTMVFTDASHFGFSGGFLDGYSGDYVPGPGGHIDYHPAANNGRYGCYPPHT